MHGHSSITPTQKRILEFFQKQPHAIETAKGMATWLCADQTDVGKALEELADRKWLLIHEASSVVGYSLTDNERLLTEIGQVLSSS